MGSALLMLILVLVGLILLVAGVALQFGTGYGLIAGGVACLSAAVVVAKGLN